MCSVQLESSLTDSQVSTPNCFVWSPIYAKCITFAALRTSVQVSLTMDDHFLTFMRLLQIHDYYEPSPSTPDSRLAATLQRQELDYALDTQRRQQGFLRPRAFETHFSNFNSAQRPLPNEESFARRRYAPSSSLSRAEPRNLGDDWLPDEIDMGLHDELEPLRSRAHDPSADVEIFAQEPPSPLIDVSEQECTPCTEKFGIFDRVAAPCGHWFCRECLQTIFTKSFDSEGLFPPRCCRQQPIPLDDTVRSLLTPEIVADYARKKLEFGTSDRDRLYCHWCSIFLVPVTTHVKHQWRCMNCKATTCSACKGKGHLGQCPPNAEDQKVFDLAEKNGWKACYNCHRIVSLGEGCNHMQLFSSLCCIWSLLIYVGVNVERSGVIFAERSGELAIALCITEEWRIISLGLWTFRKCNSYDRHPNRITGVDLVLFLELSMARQDKDYKGRHLLYHSGQERCMNAIKMSIVAIEATGISYHSNITVCGAMTDQSTESNSVPSAELKVVSSALIPYALIAWDKHVVLVDYWNYGLGVS